ncbi:MAG: alpha/beta hydrolase [Gemmatimonadota bacterium]|nr:alpha/beta hydrolase [Gemmatimonadota bacterium]MDH4351191.1 alpha/beta hydrolase [Gemmatimonadota bacterium]MDH5196654.1 alpha/beta hydrolase [Gemmatimonadota bacterium]
MSRPVREIRIATEQGSVTGLLHLPPAAHTLLVLAHGAGAGMRHRFFETIVPLMADRGVATLRYQFPYMEAGRKRPDAPPVAQATVRAAVVTAAGLAPELPLLAGGKSFGGRMTSAAQSVTPLDGVRGLVFLGFPLHAAGRPGTSRADHLDRVAIPMLFLQGTRDALADLPSIRAVTDRLGTRAVLHVIDGADHSFAVLKRSGRTNESVRAELVSVIAGWSAKAGP